MRHESCAVCTIPAFQRAGADAEIIHVVTMAERTGPGFHHHHLIRCSACFEQWFDDIVLLPGRVVAVERRGTAPCDCPEDDEPRYQSRAVIFRIPQANCRCTAADLEQEHVVVTK
jgi:hypothetical protein